MAPIFTECCGFKNPTIHKPHGKRVLGIKMLSNLSVSEQTKMRASRHSNLKVHACYQHLIDENINKKYKAMDPSLRTSSPSSSSENSISDKSHQNAITQEKAFFPSKRSSTLPTPPMNYYHQPPQNPYQIVININSPTPTPPQPSHFTHHTNSNDP